MPVPELAVVQGIVKTYGGAITALSEPGAGTVFHLFFPGMEGDAEPAPKAAVSIGSGSERILFVDDEKLLAELGQEMLASMGYEVTALTDSKEALDLFQAQPWAFDLVITDLTMPKLTGKDLAREILKIRADIPVVLCTGFSDIVNEKLAKEAGIRELIMKPYGLSDLATVIRRAVKNAL